jgi:hypothetical protein
MKAKLLLVMGLAAWVSTFALTTAARDDDEGREGEAALVAQGFHIAPVPLNLRGKNRQLVGLGSYLVNATSGCNDCHTNPSYLHGGNPFQGQLKQVNAAHYLAGGAQFGPFTSRNITPGNGLPETYAEFHDIMRHGTDPDHLHPQFGPLLQVMPWPGYQDMSEHHLRAIYEYLRSIPPALPCATVGPAATDPTCRP